MPQILDPSPEHRRRSRLGARPIVTVGLACVCVAALALGATGRPQEDPTAPQPRPIPAPLLDGPAREDPLVEGAASRGPGASGGGGWIALTGDGIRAEREAAELLREWAASRAPQVPPVEERLPNGAVKLHHRGHFLSTLYATIDEQGRLVYSHQPPTETTRSSGREPMEPALSPSPGQVEAGASKGGAR